MLISELIHELELCQGCYDEDMPIFISYEGREGDREIYRGLYRGLIYFS